jgi:hypothetical protein
VLGLVELLPDVLGLVELPPDEVLGVVGLAAPLPLVLLPLVLGELPAPVDGEVEVPGDVWAIAAKAITAKPASTPLNGVDAVISETP